MRIPCAYNELRWRFASGQARPPLRVGRLRRPRHHRPLGADGGAIDAEDARHPLRRAECLVRRPRARRARARLRRRGGPGRPRERVRSARGRRRVDRRDGRRALSRAHVLERPAHRPVGELPRPRRHRGVELGLRARDRPRRLDHPLGRGARARRAASSRSRRTTRTIPATTAASRGRWCARRSARRRPCSTRCAPGASTARPARPSTASRWTTPRSSSSAARPRASRSSRAARAVRVRTPGGSAIRRTRRSSRSTTAASSPPCRLERPYDVPYGRVEVADADGRRAWTNPLWIASSS